jgi:hypothetical protein
MLNLHVKNQLKVKITAMEQKDISNENTAMILKSIVTTNKELLLKLKVQFQNLGTIQLYTVLLLKLGYSTNEIRIILGITIKSIEETIVLTKEIKY